MELCAQKSIFRGTMQSALTCQSVIHIKTKALDLLHGQTSVDKHSGGENNTNMVNKVVPDEAAGLTSCLLEGGNTTQQH